MKRNILLTVLVALLLLPGLAFAGDFTWSEMDITPAGGGVTIAPGRNDGTNRLYVNGGGVFEYTWQASSWQIDTIERVSGWIDKDIVAGAGRNDGICRVYVGKYRSLIEYTYNGGIWEKAVVDSGNMEGYAVTLGNIKNDDTIRVLTAVNDSITVAYTYQSTGNTWKSEMLGTTNNTIHGITVGQGRNDDTNRVYTGGWNARFYEYWYESGVWNKYSLGYSYYSTIGDARSDGIKRLYLQGLAEFTWKLDHWAYNEMDTNSNSYSGRSVIANGRNDGKQRLYVAAEQLGKPTDSIDYYYVYVLEKTYDSINGWVRKEIPAVIGGLPEFMKYVVAGDARNDGKNRIYGHCSSGNLFEFAWDDTVNGVGQEEIKVVNDIKVRKVLNVGPNPFFSYTNISNLPNNEEIKVYDITGRLVEKSKDKIIGQSLKTGIYFIMAEGYKTVKIIKIK